MRLTDEGDRPIVVNANTFCFFGRCAPDRVEIHFVANKHQSQRNIGVFENRA